MSKELIVLLAGGWSGEREVSLNSGEQCSAALSKAGYELTTLDPSQELDKLFALAPQIKAVVPVLHGTFGEDGRVQGLLDCLGLPYPGAGVEASVVSMNKVIAKERFKAAGLKTAKDATVAKGAPYDPDQIAAEIGLPLAVKPAREGSSLALTMVDEVKDLPSALDRVFETDDLALIEQCLQGTELTCGVLELPETGLTPLPPIEIRPKTARFFDYEAKYTPGATDEICPAPISDELTKRVQETALTAHRCLGLIHWSRTDMFLVGDDLIVLETNTIPGMSAASLMPKAAAAAGIDLGALLSRLVELAVRDRGPKK